MKDFVHIIMLECWWLAGNYVMVHEPGFMVHEPGLHGS